MTLDVYRGRKTTTQQLFRPSESICLTPEFGWKIYMYTRTCCTEGSDALNRWFLANKQILDKATNVAGKKYLRHVQTVYT